MLDSAALLLGDRGELDQTLFYGVASARSLGISTLHRDSPIKVCNISLRQRHDNPNEFRNLRATQNRRARLGISTLLLADDSIACHCMELETPTLGWLVTVISHRELTETGCLK